MKTLIFNGSPRKNGNTAFLVNLLAKNLRGEVIINNTCEADIGPCRDCRYCWEHLSCSILDGMQKFYKEIVECDNIVIASSINFSELTGTLLNVASRLQMFYAARRFLNTEPVTKEKKGAIILCGGGDGKPDKAISTAKILLKTMNAHAISTICSLQTDTAPSSSDEQAIAQIIDLANQLNG